MPRPTQVSPRSIARCPYGSFTLCAAVFQTASGSCYRYLLVILQPRHVLEHDGLGSSLFARHYWGNRSFLSSPPGTKMFQFPGFAPSITTVPGLQPGGLPHSDTPGSVPVCGSPGIFAAYRVLLRLPKPRHPPYALASLSL